MRCGRILVKGEAEEIAVSPRPRLRQKHGKRSNPYSTGGLDKFESVYAELSAKREYIAKKTGTPEALVMFEYSKNGWIPAVVTPREANGKKNDGAAGAAGALITGSVEKNNGEKDGELRRRDEGNDINGGSEGISISGFDERSPSLVMPSSRLLKITALGFLGLSAMWMRRLDVSVAAAMAVVMEADGVMCKKFIVSRVSYFTTLFRNPNTSKSGGGVDEIAEQKEVYKLSRRTPRLGLTMDAPSSSPLRAHLQPIDFSASASPRAAKQKTIDPEHKHHQSKAKSFRRVVSMENWSTRTARPQCSRRKSWAMANDGSVGGIVMIITLLCLVFYGRLCAIFFTCAWWYLLPMLVEQRMRGMSGNNNSRMVDLQSGDYKMKVIMDGLLERNHN